MEDNDVCLGLECVGAARIPLTRSNRYSEILDYHNVDAQAADAEANGS